MASKILLVDDEKFFLEGLKEGLSEYKDSFTPETVTRFKTFTLTALEFVLFLIATISPAIPY